MSEDCIVVRECNKTDGDYHDAGHEEAAWNDNASQEYHEDPVCDCEDEERPQCEVAVVVLAHFILV